MASRRITGRGTRGERPRVEESARRDEFKSKPAGATVLVEPNTGPTTRRGGFANGESIGRDPSDTFERIIAEPQGASGIETHAVTVAVHEVRSVHADPVRDASVGVMPIRAVADAVGPSRAAEAPPLRTIESSPVRAVEAAPVRGAETTSTRAAGAGPRLASDWSLPRAEALRGYPGAGDPYPRGPGSGDSAAEGQTRQVICIGGNAQSLVVRALPAGQLERSPSAAIGGNRGGDELVEPMWPRLAVVGVQAAPAEERTILSVADKPTSERAEHYRLLRHRLQSTGAPRCFAIASPHAGREASVCAAELALAYAEAEKDNVLLIDLDSRQRCLGSVLGVSAAHSFTEQMQQRGLRDELPWRALSVYRDNLHVMPMAVSPAEHQRVRPDALKAALQELQQLEYGQIIVVCPQVLETSDVAMFAGAIDGVVLAGCVGKTTGQQLRKAALAVAPTRVIGVAVLEG